MRPPAVQGPIEQHAFDRWISAQGELHTEFYRLPDAILLRFPEIADFFVDPETLDLRCVPVPQVPEGDIEDIVANSIVPALTNHRGGLCLHGSAVSVNGNAIAFMGLSRRGKTTLAGAFARAGFPFLTEDVIELELSDGEYIVQPQRPVLRLFGDSADFLTGMAPGTTSASEKAALSKLPFEPSPRPLRGIYLLGPGSAEGVAIAELGEAQALAESLRHAFILDVEDRARLHGHFDRLAQLVAKVPCYNLDYPRRFENLEKVVAKISGTPTDQRSI